MAEPLPPVRRIVTGHDAEGRSVIQEDGPAPAVKTIPQRPDYRLTNLWVTRQTPAPVDAPDCSTEHEGIQPPRNGTVIRIIDIPPEPADGARNAEMVKAVFASQFPDADRSDADGRHPGMHRTATVDYALVLEGEVYAVMDQEETLMRAGDVLIQRGTNHAWSNRSDRVCRIAFILIDGQAGNAR